jgi:hypothetical protein
MKEYVGEEGGSSIILDLGITWWKISPPLFFGYGYGRVGPTLWNNETFLVPAVNRTPPSSTTVYRMSYLAPSLDFSKRDYVWNVHFAASITFRYVLNCICHKVRQLCQSYTHDRYITSKFTLPRRGHEDTAFWYMTPCSLI